MPELLLAEVAERVANATWGFVPARDIKPVHLANGMFRALAGPIEPDLALLKKVVATMRGKTQKSSTEIIEIADFRAASELPLSTAVAEGAVTQLRKALDVVLNQDGAFYEGSTSTPTLSHWHHLTKDPSDQRAGHLLAHVLLGAPERAAALAIRGALSKNDDAVYRLTAPLLGNQEDELPAFPAPDSDIQQKAQESCVLKNLQESFTTLAEYEPYLDKTALLQRTVTLAGFGLLLHLFNGNSDTCQPLLLCASDHPMAVREASRHTLALARRRLRSVFGDSLRQELIQRGDHKLSEEEYRDWASTWLPAESFTADQIQRYALEYEQELLAGETHFEAAVRALTGPAMAIIGRTKSGQDSVTPEGCSKHLGRRIGLQWPRKHGRGERYLMPVGAVYDALVTSLLHHKEVIQAEVFWELAYKRFGLICGALPEVDGERLARLGIRNVTSAQLAANARGIIEDLTRLGYARTYADDVTLISAMW
ncbi:hypothetical protein SAMN02745146_0178 [Hymenobacter daecheongensis DSM 21074]|uniref:Uncharacterized protein n=1 Tax=Hymenobacter daecheongensis DSM 21074 TaxID=1121955 RepID=A0A1M6M752_9BACT|nr:hypothetical protein [Hymenobacter daecheongensis]SHJ79267.1 hypothetical protein SAMN02745146_0178 [Hymenobacter daecheongensis DSM 21074]